MIRELKIAVSASGKEAQYDEHAKNIAGQKFIIANILAKSVEAFRGMKPKDIIPYIEGEPYISKVPVEPGLTNAAREENGQRVVGLNTENQEINEGLVRAPLRRCQECVLYLDLHEYGGKQHEPYSPDQRRYDGKPAVEGRTGFVPYRYDWDWKRPARTGRKL